MAQNTHNPYFDGLFINTLTHSINYTNDSANIAFVPLIMLIGNSTLRLGVPMGGFYHDLVTHAQPLILTEFYLYTGRGCSVRKGCCYLLLFLQPRPININRRMNTL